MKHLLLVLFHLLLFLGVKCQSVSAEMDEGEYIYAWILDQDSRTLQIEFEKPTTSFWVDIWTSDGYCAEIYWPWEAGNIDRLDLHISENLNDGVIYIWIHQAGLYMIHKRHQGSVVLDSADNYICFSQ